SRLFGIAPARTVLIMLVIRAWARGATFGLSRQAIALDGNAPLAIVRGPAAWGLCRRFLFKREPWMRRTWIVVWTATAVTALAGCYSNGVKRVERPELVEEYRLPPDDVRYSTAVSYPKEALNQGVIKKDTSAGQGLPPLRGTQPQFGGGGGMGRG